MKKQCSLFRQTVLAFSLTLCLLVSACGSKQNVESERENRDEAAKASAGPDSTQQAGEAQ
ncbi:hypothetical protein [Rufibacter immobilis]|uniref:hypothetical protein n=1 Tax=Rufibacter immobilis TaxID=1348778 RepID=UPI0011CDDAFE|nr:hypothetical protein [Rufibacter immobilis]